MRRLQIAVALVTAASPMHASTAVAAWDAGASVGTGQFVGSGFGSNGASVAAATSVGVSLWSRLALRGLLHYQRLRLRATDGVDTHAGNTLLGLLALHVYPRRPGRIVQPYLGPVAGAGFVVAEARTETASVDSRLRGFFLGGDGGVLFGPPSGRWALGPSFLGAAFFITRQCVAVEDSFVACTSGDGVRQAFISSSATFRWRF
jgi:hypothetical protein